MPEIGEVVARVGVGEGTAPRVDDGIEAGDEHVGRDASQQRLVDPLKYLPRRRGVQGLSGELTPSALIHGPKHPLRIPRSTLCAWTVAQSSRVFPLRYEPNGRHAVGVEADAELQLRRCPNLRGPTRRRQTTPRHYRHRDPSLNCQSLA